MLLAATLGHNRAYSDCSWLRERPARKRALLDKGGGEVVDMALGIRRQGRERELLGVLLVVIIPSRQRREDQTCLV